MSEVPWSRRGDGLALLVRLTPKSSRDGIDGTVTLADGATVMKARVRAAPEAGAANEALLQLLAKSLKLPPSSLAITSGASARLKTIHMAGDPVALAERLTALIGSGK